MVRLPNVCRLVVQYVYQHTCSLRLLFVLIDLPSETMKLTLMDDHRLNEQGYPLGLRLLSLLTARTHMPTLSSTPPPSSSNTSNPQRPTRILPLLQFLSNTLWRTLFSRPCDSLEKSATNANEYMLSDNEPLTNMFVSVPKEMSMFNPGAYVAGIIEGVCDGLGLTARVSAHNAGTEMWPQRTVWLLAFDEGVVRREELLVKAERDAKR